VKKGRLLIPGVLVFSIIAAACATGVSEEEFEAVKADLQTQQAQVQSLQAELAELQQRISRVAAITEALELFTTGPEGGLTPDPAVLQEISTLVQASNDPQLQAKWAEIAEAALASAGPPPFELLSELAALIEASGDVEIQAKFQEFASAALRGEGAAPALELIGLIQASGDQALQAKMGEFIQAVLKNAQIPLELFEEFAALVLASGNEEIQEKVQQLAALPPEFIESFEAKVRAIGDPSLDAQLEGLFTPGLGEERHSDFLRSLIAVLNDALR